MAQKTSALQSLKTQLLSVFGALTLALLYFGISSLIENTTNLQELDRVDDAQAIAVTSGALVHELQKERGLSAGFIGSKGGKFKEDLSSQRQLTDSAVSAFNNLKSKVALQYLSESALSRLSLGNKALEQLLEKRSGIDQLRLEGAASFSYYSETIEHLLDMTSESGKISTQDNTSKSLLALDLFQRTKENAGRERATVNAIVVGNKPVTPAQYRTLSSVTSAQVSLGKMFSAIATPERAKQFHALLESEKSQAVEKMRQQVFDKAGEGEYGIEAAVWFKTITDKIDLLKIIEDKLVADLAVQVLEAREDGKIAMMVAIAAIALSVVFTALFLWVMIRLIRGLREAQEGVERLAAGDFSHNIAVDRKDELGDLQVSLADIQQSIRSLTADANLLSEAAVAGKLEVRADAGKHRGEYQKIIAGVNATLDSVINPLNVTAKYVDDISKGVIPPVITD
ncbi:MAG: nitrate- and nitrite sensing domain-containing protein, partial [Rhodocyclaceae bacterium]|nr:nitrate- and nitrite sensing domain-containing protein [Rhodocyclaceae bacterium]